MLLLPRPTQMLRPILKGSVFELLVCILKQVGFTSVYWPAYHFQMDTGVKWLRGCEVAFPEETKETKTTSCPQHEDVPRGLKSPE